MSFQPVPPHLLFSRKDPTDLRLGELTHVLPAMKTSGDFGDSAREVMQTTDPETKNFFIGGYPDDEGIRMNGGRLGAQEGPNEIRRWLYRMTPALLGQSEFALWDAGDLYPSHFTIDKRHEFAADCALAVLNEGARWIGLGGGHDYGFADAAAFLRWSQVSAKQTGLRPIVINFDAHLDVRPVNDGFSSGTPFFRMLEMGLDVDFAEIGIQSQCNSRAHLQWAREKGTRVLTQEEIEVSGEPLVTQVMRLLGDWILRPRPVFLSIDIDGFSSAVAPGCSQSWATGFMPDQFFPVLNLLAKRLDVRMLGIYEVSPALDQDGRTAKLAAQIVHRVVTT